MRERSVDGQGKFGSVEGDPPASRRRPEARLARSRRADGDMKRTPSISLPTYDESRTEAHRFFRCVPKSSRDGGTESPSAWQTTMPPPILPR